MKGFVAAGIGTDIGKTLVSAVLVEALQADYWKPVQAGSLDNTDTDIVRSLVSNSKSVFHPSVYNLSKPMSPQAAADIDGATIDLNKLTLPETNNTLLIELPGGLMVPLNHHQLNIDLMASWNLPVILVSQNYLGSINHTLLSVAALKNEGIDLEGIIFNGNSNAVTEDFILQYTKLECIGRVPQLKEINKETIRQVASEFTLQLKTV
jgi:dethiobiotin synthetase